MIIYPDSLICEDALTPEICYMHPGFPGFAAAAAYGRTGFPPLAPGFITYPTVSLGPSMISSVGMASSPGVSPSAITQGSSPAELALAQGSPIFACGTTVGLQIPRSPQIATAAPVVGVPRPPIPCNPSILTLTNQVPVPGYGYLPLSPAGVTERGIPPAAYADFGANPVVSAAQLALPAPHSITPRSDSGTSALTLATASHLQRDTLARAAGPTLGATVLGSFGSYPTTTSPLNRAFSANSPPTPMDMFSQESVTYIQHNTATSPQPGAFTAFGLGRTSGLTSALLAGRNF